MVFALEEFELDGAAPIAALIVPQLKPDIDSSTPAIGAAEGFFELH